MKKREVVKTVKQVVIAYGSGVIMSNAVARIVPPQAGLFAVGASYVAGYFVACKAAKEADDFANQMIDEWCELIDSTKKKEIEEN